MSFSKEWEEGFKANTHMSIWPWSKLVSYVTRYALPDGPSFRVLELGCGAGANIPFFLKLGVQYFSIDGSPTVVTSLWKKFPQLKNNIIVGDYTKSIPFPGKFDLVVDRASLSHNTTSSINNCLAMVKAKLKLGRKYIGIDWFSTKHNDYQQGLPDEDIYTRRGYTEGPFAYIGRVHFSSKTHLEELFCEMEIEVMEHKTIVREIPADNTVIATWNLVTKRI